MSIEAMKLWLEALELNEKCSQSMDIQICADASQKTFHAITTLRQAIEQAQKQEPVAWRNALERIADPRNVHFGNDARVVAKSALDTTQPQRQPLTDEEMRIQFETWHKEKHSQSLERHGHTYKNAHVRTRWEGWQAAHGIKGEA